MAVTTKTKNGNIATDAMVDMAAQASEEAKVVVNNFVEAVNTYNGNSLSYLDAQQKLMQSNLDLYQKYSSVYSDFVLSACQQVMDQSLALREQFDKMTEDYYKKAQALGTSEQKFFVETVEAFQTQVKSNSERVAELFTPAK